MKKQVLFIQGGGDGGYEADQALADSLQKALGTEYEVTYPRIQTDESAPDFGWVQEIGQHILATQGAVILIGHSFGASMLLKYLSENRIEKKLAGVFLLSTPYWSGEEDWQQGLKLEEHFGDQLPREVPVFFYHCRDDDEVPFSHLTVYRQKLARAVFRELDHGGHQLDNNLDAVAQDIRSLYSGTT